MTDEEFQRFRAEHPSWSIWWAGGSAAWRAVPLWEGAPLELAEASTLGELDEHMRFLDRRRRGPART